MSEEGKVIANQRFYTRSTPLTKYSTQTNSRHWFLKVTFGLCILCALFWSWQKITDPRTFPVRQVQIRGNYSHVDREALRETVLPFIQNGFLSIDTNGLQDRLQQLSWVDFVQVKRKWPEILTITLKEQQPIARFIGDGVLINERGELFTVDPVTVPANLPFFSGPAGQQKLLLENYQQMSAVLAPLHLKIAQLILNARGGFVLQLDDGMVLLLGRFEPIQRLQRWVKVYAQVVGNRSPQINSIDLRYMDGLAVTFKN